MRTAASPQLAVLEDVCDLITDGTHHSPPNGAEGDYLYVTSKNIRPGRVDLSDISYVTAEVHETIYARCPVQKGDVLYVKDGVNAGTAAVNTVTEPFSMLSSVALIRPKPGLLDSAYLVHWLNSEEGYETMIRTKSGSAITRLILREIRRCRFPFPSFAQQRRIAEVLDRAESLRAKRRAALAQADALTQAIFLEMFGHPIQNPKYSRATIRPFVIAGSGKSANAVKSDTPTNVPIYGGNGQNGWATKPLFDEPVLIFGRVGQQCGNSFVTDRPVWVTDNAIAVQLADRTAADMIYLHYAFGFTGFSQSVKHLDLPFINQGMILDFKLPLPPLRFQQEFARRVAAVERLKSSHRISMAKLDELFASLQYRAFRGEL